MWELLDISELKTFDELLQLIEDAKCHGFEFKLENYKIYFREMDLNDENVIE